MTHRLAKLFQFSNCIKLLVFLFLASPTSYAFIPGFTGPYIEGNVGYGHVYSSPSPRPTGVAGNINGGYQFGPNFGGEIGYTAYPSVSSTSTNNQSVDFSIRFILPVTDTQFNLFAKTGLAIASHTVPSNLSNAGTYTSLVAYLGGGVAVTIAPNLELLGQADVTTTRTNIPTMLLVGGGLRYIFHFL